MFMVLNDNGVDSFSDWLERGAKGARPSYLLTDSSTAAEKFPESLVDGGREFGDRYEFGKYLQEQLLPLDDGTLESDRNFWSTLALIWFDKLCPQTGAGARKVDKTYRYVLSPHFRHHYRHLVQPCWQLVRDHGENARFMLLASRRQGDRLGRHGDILEQIGARQSSLRNKVVIEVAAAMYSSPDSGRPARGAAGRGGGSARRLGTVLRQLDLTYDFELLGAVGLRALLPREFDRWDAPSGKEPG